MFKLSAGIVSKKNDNKAYAIRRCKFRHKWFSLEFLLPSRLNRFALFLIAQSKQEIKKDL
jgi:hypothetical protein